MTGKEITVRATGGGTFKAYVAEPDQTPAPGILVLQEIFGVNHVMRALVDGFAASGYIAACPDLFWRQEPGIQITDRTEAEWARAFELYKGFDEAKGIEDAKATLRVLRTRKSCTARIGAVGYCLGGKLAYLMATRSDVDASVGYYGVGIENALAEATAIAKPLLLHIAGADQFVPPAAQEQVTAALAGNPLVTLHTYQGRDHAFARVGGQHYHQAAAELANRRTADFFAQHLR
ncbi:MAG: dienelactone hydrolase family protein [Alphaproteobacteria bacterium]|nr:dienelactone hydrolase family protein [Alphaproteobacteria bacterium]